MIKLLCVILFMTLNLLAQQNPPATVKMVDLDKYTGLWYEISKIPNRFQKHCVSGTTAEYKLMEDGRIEVINSCIDDEGERDAADGVARVVDKNSNAKLEVSFFSILGWRPFWGDYWIIGLDVDYKWAVIGTPDRKYGWVLSRTKELDAESLDTIQTILKEQGYNWNDFVKTSH
ncbi:MAG: lipocalin family protein [Ignavibacteriaceae bacterium]